MQSSYSIDLVTGAGLRPSLSTWASGSFVQDYNYDQSGDLDEFNGKFIQPGEVSEFSEGTYAYFSTIDSTTKKPSFPLYHIKTITITLMNLIMMELGIKVMSILILENIREM